MDRDVKPLYRQALGAFPTGVAMVVLREDGAAHGLVVNSFTSVSLEPPLVMFCLGDGSDRGVRFRRAEHFSLNILAAEQLDLTRQVATRGQSLLPPQALVEGEDAAPALAGALTRLYCRIHERVHVGDHMLIIGKVERFDTRPGTALGYFRGRYVAVPRDEAGDQA